MPVTKRTSFTYVVLYRNFLFGTFDDVMHRLLTWTRKELQFESADKTGEQLPLTQSHYRGLQTAVL